MALSGLFSVQMMEVFLFFVIYGLCAFAAVNFFHLLFRLIKDPNWLFVRYLHNESAGPDWEVSFFDKISLGSALIFYSVSIGIGVFYALSLLPVWPFLSTDGTSFSCVIAALCAFSSLSIIDSLQRHVAWRHYGIVKGEARN